MIYRPDRWAYLVSALPCLAGIGVGVVARVRSWDEMLQLLTVAGVITWALLWSNLAGQRVTLTGNYIEKTRFWMLRTRIARGAIEGVSKGTNPLTDGPYTIVVAGGGSRLKINLKLYPVELARAIEEMT